MRILIHGINFSPELTGIGKYSGEMAKWLAAQGHEVRVVSAPPYYPQWCIADGFANRWSSESVQCTSFQENGGSLTVYRCPLWVPVKPSGLKRILHLASFALSSFPVMLGQIFWRPSVVLVVEPPLFCAPHAWLAARLSGAKAWLHVQDFEVDAAFDLGILRAAWARRWVLFVERWLTHRFDRVSTISDRMLERLRSKGVESNKAILFSNWVDLEAIHPMRDAGGFRRQLGISPDRIVALYSGNMGEKQGLEIVLEAAARLQGSVDVHFVLCGDGAARLRLQKEHNGLPNVIWLPLQPLDRLNELLNLADIHLLPQRADVADLVMPSKLTGMLASGRPVIATALPGTQVASVCEQCGLVVPPGDAGTFAEAVLSLAVDAPHRLNLGIKARAYAELNFGHDAILSRFESELQLLIKS